MESMPGRFKGDLATLLKVLGAGSAFILIVVVIMITSLNVLHSVRVMHGENARVAVFFD